MNGAPKEESKFRKMSCYITQEDLLQPMLTLNELMMFAADLKLSTSKRKEKKLVVSSPNSCFKVGSNCMVKFAQPL